MKKEVKKYTVFRSPQDGQIYVTRNIPPIFTAKYTNGALQFDDETPDPEWLDKRMRGIDVVVHRFIKQEDYERRKEKR